MSPAHRSKGSGCAGKPRNVALRSSALGTTVAWGLRMKVDRPFSFGIAPRSIAAMFAVLAFPLFAIVGCSGASVDAGGESDPGQVASSADDLRGTGAGCTQNSQCRSRVCVRHVCRAPSCTDGATNGSETDVDCG